MYENIDLAEANRILEAQRVAGEVLRRSNQIHKDKDNDSEQCTQEDLEATVVELLNQGVTIGKAVESKSPYSRIVYRGSYQNKPVAIKFAITKLERYANIREKRIYSMAKADGRGDEFAQVFMLTSDTNALVQEWCTNFRIVEDWQKPRDRWFFYNQDIESKAIDPATGKVDFKKLTGRPLETTIKYKIYEIQMGKNRSGKFVYVDYGT